MFNLNFIAMVNYSKTTLTKEGTLVDGDITYNVTFTAVNNELTRLSCTVTKKKTVQYPDGNGGNVENQEDVFAGSITLEHGRQITEFVQGENVMPYLLKFQGILDEVLGKSTPPTT